MKTGKAKRGVTRYRVLGHIWIDGAEGTFLGLGRVELLEGIRDIGSITGAARSLGMSYRKAWQAVRSMNAQSEELLVVVSAGGRGGGGAVVTEAGNRCIRAFRRMDADFRRFMDGALKRAGLSG